MLAQQVERVPAHVRDLQALVARHDLLDVAADPVQAFGDDVFLAAARHQLHADANTKEGRALTRTASVIASTMPLTASSPRRQSAKGADARQHQDVGAVGLIRIAGDEDLLRNLQAARGALECLGGGMQIAGTVIDDGERSS
jgi:hypothetical protein